MEEEIRELRNKLEAQSALIASLAATLVQNGLTSHGGLAQMEVHAFKTFQHKGWFREFEYAQDRTTEYFNALTEPLPSFEKRNKVKNFAPLIDMVENANLEQQNHEILFTQLVHFLAERNEGFSEAFKDFVFKWHGFSLDDAEYFSEEQMVIRGKIEQFLENFFETLDA